MNPTLPLLVVTFPDHALTESLLVLVIAFFGRLEYACAARTETKNEGVMQYGDQGRDLQNSSGSS